jgi:hypothetical protein
MSSEPDVAVVQDVTSNAELSADDPCSGSDAAVGDGVKRAGKRSRECNTAESEFDVMDTDSENDGENTAETARDSVEPDAGILLCIRAKVIAHEDFVNHSIVLVIAPKVYIAHEDLVNHSIVLVIAPDIHLII